VEVSIMGGNANSDALAVYHSTSTLAFYLKAGGTFTTSGNIGIGTVGFTPVSRFHIDAAPTASANYGLVSYGSGAFDGSTSGFFVGAAAGTLIAGNLASGSTSDLMRLQVAGNDRFRVANNGNIICGGSVTAITNVTAGAGSGLEISSRFYMLSPSTGVLGLYNWAGTGFDRLQFGGTTSSFPALKRSTTTIEVRLADDSGYGATQSLYDRFGSGSPESVVTAPIGAIYHRTDGGAGTSLYVKESGAGNTGWIAK
jgi:hypothetical protein